MSTATKTNHIGRKITRIRELRGMKQEALALELGISQQAVSLLENKESIEKDLLSQVAKILGVTPEAIENFDEEKMINYFNTFNDQSFSNNHGAIQAMNCTFNPLDKLVEVFEENKKLYERLLEAEKEKNTVLQKLLEHK
ncbi:MAG: helix-turn-helix domain-containing protein [Sphingobacterium sp.]|uniref:helix-turn-helix domain-containing protein n=1 Tax=Sphingobacterium sp. JB170 TaxID=1434842 RepID=UPI00097F6355|nr:helix-turn-helix transcriptional regulator [Sphingobacterium sp. JB170]SJN16312.1 transcriptional regulator, XRE family [Sphingobacterium sp. JB170]